MNAFRAKPVDGPEDVIQRALVNHLKLHDWYVKVMHGTAFQSGLPDLFCTHVSYGMRWVEVKVPVGGKFTRAQYVTFPKLVEHGTPVWILTGPHEYQALFSDCNWWHYLDKLSVQAGEYVENAPLRHGEESKIQFAIIERLRQNGWYCRITYGDEYQNGVPDVYATHPKYGPRWIEVKKPVGWRFTPAQSKTFPLMVANGSGVWILTDPNQLDLLHRPNNYYQFLLR